MEPEISLADLLTIVEATEKVIDGDESASEALPEWQGLIVALFSTMLVEIKAAIVAQEGTGGPIEPERALSFALARARASLNGTEPPHWRESTRRTATDG